MPTQQFAISRYRTVSALEVVGQKCFFFFFFFNYKIIRVGGGINGKIHGICPVNFVNVSSISISQDILSCHLQLVIVSTALDPRLTGHVCMQG